MPEQAPQTEEKASWRRWLLYVALVILVLFVALNSQEVEVKFIVGSAQMPLIFALVVAALLGALVGWALSRVRGKRE